ncbi:MAG: nitrous oxide reductase accessory protein NosL [Thermodesulfobacteriota bacterium]
MKQHTEISRRSFLGAITVATCCGAISSFTPVTLFAGEVPAVEHPMQQPKNFTDKDRCPNCGMGLNMWARTRHEFTNSEGSHGTCSIRCLADMSKNSGEQPRDVKVALYLKPEQMVHGTSAVYVVGSSAKGTMTMNSKIAFDSREAAEKFTARYGGTVTDYKKTLAMATMELGMSRPKIEAKRRKKGKFAEPSVDARCVVCDMYPARYPGYRCQATTTDKKRYHFCSTQCMVYFKADPKKYLGHEAKIKSYWVTALPDGGFEYGGSLYYLVGSSVMGPMGLEALPYRSKADAQATAKKEGGRVVRFGELNPEVVMGS